MIDIGFIQEIFAKRRIREKKQQVRNQIRQLLKTQEEEDRLRKSSLILEKLLATPEFQSSKTILFYAAFGGEVETFEMMRRAMALGKQVALPLILKDQRGMIPKLIHNLEEDLENGPYGIRQPRADASGGVRTDDLNLVIVPGIAFDRDGHRLGRGAGYYDRFLAKLPRDIPSIGLGFDFQLRDDLPLSEHDVPLSRILVA
jgi:5-formyltetrahydrofolate cyclo-ligase